MMSTAGLQVGTANFKFQHEATSNQVLMLQFFAACYTHTVAVQAGGGGVSEGSNHSQRLNSNLKALLVGICSG